LALIRTNGYVQLRRGLLEHVMNGSMSLIEMGLYVAVLVNADPASGIWRGSGELLGTWLNLSPRTSRDQLARLEVKGYIKRFVVPGRAKPYPILVHNYECSAGAMKGLRLNARKSTSYTAPVYEHCRDIADESAGESAGLLIETVKRREGEKAPRARRASDHRYSDFLCLIKAWWEFAHPGGEMVWGPSEAGQLGELLRSSPSLTAEQFKQCLYNRHRSEGINLSERPRYWLGKITSYAGGPLNLFHQPAGGSNAHGSNGHGSKGEQRAQQIKRDLAAVLAERNERMAAEAGR
jgi:hypothetical protein